jgi:hypothetical protein
MADEDTSDALSYPPRILTREAFELELLRISLGAQGTISALITDTFEGGPDMPATVGDARAVWHAAQVALAGRLEARIGRVGARAVVSVANTGSSHRSQRL